MSPFFHIVKYKQDLERIIEVKILKEERLKTDTSNELKLELNQKKQTKIINWYRPYSLVKYNPNWLNLTLNSTSWTLQIQAKAYWKMYVYLRDKYGNVWRVKVVVLKKIEGEEERNR